jgi:outer membrane protein assembly factor BamB
MIADTPDGVLRLAAGGLEVALWEDHTYTRNSADNVHRYDREVVFAADHWIAFGVRVSEGGRELASMVVLSLIGCGTLCAENVVAREGVLLLPDAGDVVAFELPSLRERWRARTEGGCVSALHTVPGEDALIVHGELTIARISADGRVEWERGGRDILSGALRIGDGEVEVTDWNEDVYRFRLSDGEVLAAPPAPPPPSPTKPPVGWMDRVAGWFRR